MYEWHLDSRRSTEMFAYPTAPATMQIKVIGEYWTEPANLIALNMESTLSCLCHLWLSLVHVQFGIMKEFIFSLLSALYYSQTIIHIEVWFLVDFLGKTSVYSTFEVPTVILLHCPGVNKSWSICVMNVLVKCLHEFRRLILWNKLNCFLFFYISKFHFSPQI